MFIKVNINALSLYSNNTKERFHLLLVVSTCNTAILRKVTGMMYKCNKAMLTGMHGVSYFWTHRSNGKCWNIHGVSVTNVSSKSVLRELGMVSQMVRK